ncbi:helix-turn-helix domain-containing protein [Paenibacillus chartarius]|uniref:Helix-turn-helix domain-containing protein n=1 Tax=Paenibacillus chartarius TaxID=747481 RepID=A0ABV6DJQ1_9BACL
MSAKKGIFDRMIELASDKDNLYYISNKQYFPLPLRISRCRGLSSQEKLVLMELLYCFGDNDEAFPSIEYLAFQLDVDDKTVSKNIKKLIEKKFISVYKSPNRVNRYYIHLLESNPYITLSELTLWFEKTIQTRGIPKQDLIPQIRKEVRRVTESAEYTSFLSRLMIVCAELLKCWNEYCKHPDALYAKSEYDKSCRQEREILNEYLAYLNEVMNDKFGTNVRTVQPLVTV